MRGFPRVIYPSRFRVSPEPRWHNVYFAPDGRPHYGSGHSSQERACEVGHKGRPRPAYRIKVIPKTPEQKA